ncbi:MULTISPECIES: multidrug efflux SMR transporter [Actinosynnema]|uniref:Small multidrug resistance protein n=3 Tax=Actinosynnema TaxID=40566 RepID=C6W7W9_ACTMD|nr:MULTISPECIES: multidrug efflux SMR transporter [Actinosynnema]AXX30473.1 Quaternary ammonium compound-resistance protein SugE [Actinosynnema pretiosum subsp. pretiosum]ACU36990.1 small multidrug resistance protein [Actinosynnema mirum DSM 43827]ATE54548.1 QacE family quaternary ammonium compound efflux SMR transporter [Actinosynnema pretiosum]MCP2098539.1 small multidrug resistance pump [Actinosynnema pretiosum]QUF05384.1 multidrug efflux SMR transporter [Actinosynnema pretiosum subsp. pret
MLKWFLLSLAVCSEVFATLCLKASHGFTKPLPVLGLVVGYGIAFYLEAQVIRLGLPVAITYAIWAGGGIALVAVAGRVLFADPIAPGTLAGMALIAAGVGLVATTTAVA